MGYTKRELVKRDDGTTVYYVEGVDGDGDLFVGYENVPVEPEPDPLAAARAKVAAGAVRLAKDGGTLTTDEQVELVNVALGRPVQPAPIVEIGRASCWARV